jgi:hypothetical protein
MAIEHPPIGEGISVSELANQLASAPEPTPAPVATPSAAEIPELSSDSSEGRIMRFLTLGDRSMSQADVENAPRDWRLTPEEHAALRQYGAFHDHLRTEEAKLVAAEPNWKDTARGRAEIARLKQFAKREYKVTDQDVDNAFTNAAVVLLVRDAYRTRQQDQQTPVGTKRAIRAAGGHVFGTSPGEPLKGSPSAAAAIRALLE